MLNGLMNIGQSALNASQAWITVTGNNLANADTEGYSRQYVDQKDAGGLTYRPGASPLGVNAQQIMRFFDAFLEKSYVRQSTNSERWSQQDTIMASVENIFNEANRTGVNSALNNFFNAWQDLALRPDDISVRQSLLSYADNLADMLSNTKGNIQQIQQDMDVSIEAAVNRVNDIAKSIADLNNQITAQTVDGVNNPNSLLDKRDQLVRELATYVDVETIDHGKGDFRVQLTTGQPLVDGTEKYSLDFLAARKETALRPESTYNGDIKFEGTDSHEYTVIIHQENDKDYIKVSLDGGSTFIKDENGSDKFEITTSTVNNETVVNPILVKNLTISFTDHQNFNAGDKFTIVPKTGLYWIEPTKGPQNITPQIGMDGVENPNRVTGGKLAAYFNVRDDNCGRYLDELDAVARSLVWEVNRIHSQGAGLSKYEFVQGQQRVENSGQPLGTAQSGLPYYDKLQAGNVNFHFYDKNSGDHIDSALLFEGANFNPEKDSLDDVALKLKNLTINVPDENGNPKQINPFEATTQDGKLQIGLSQQGRDNNIEFVLGADSSGLMAALGVNTFFTGTNAGDIAVNSVIHTDTSFIAAGQVNGDFEINHGDNATAVELGKLADKKVTINAYWKQTEHQSISQYYANLVTTVGTDRRLSKTNTEYHSALTNDLFDRVASVTGVNMDEEMSNLIKYQHSYTAAAKLITTADQMLETLLGLKQ